MRAIDTNVLLRLILRDDDRQTAAAEQFVRDGAWTSTLALAETVWVLSSIYGFGPKELAAAVETLMNHQKLTVQDSDAVGTALELFHQNSSLGFSDCLMVALARNAGHLPLGTFDRRLAKMDGAQLVGVRQN
jgi:predicted nucleic-acid-binding protein